MELWSPPTSTATHLSVREGNVCISGIAGIKATVVGPYRYSGWTGCRVGWGWGWGGGGVGWGLSLVSMQLAGTDMN